MGPSEAGAAMHHHRVRAEAHWGSIRDTWPDFIDEPCSQDDLDTWCDERPGADYCSA